MFPLELSIQGKAGMEEAQFIRQKPHKLQKGGAPGCQAGATLYVYLLLFYDSSKYHVPELGKNQIVQKYQ